MPTDYVKCYTTKVDPRESQGHILSALHRYGASGFGFHQRGAVVEVTFHMPDDVGGPERTVRIPVNIDRIHAKLVPQVDAIRKSQKRALDASRKQAERVAWRILLDWIEAALSAVAIGAQTIEEAFYAHVVIETTDGQTGRLIDYVHTMETASGTVGRLPGLGRAIDNGAKLLTAGTTE